MPARVAHRGFDEPDDGAAALAGATESAIRFRIR